MLEKRAIKVSLQKNQLSQNQFLSNLFVLKKNGWGYQRVINLKTLNHFVPYMHFIMESLQTLKYMMKERDYMCKIDLIDAYFTVPLDKSSFSKVFMGREPLRIPVSAFWPWTNPSSFYRVFTFQQNFESPNIPFAPSKYQDFDLLGQHVVNVSINRETSSRKRHRNLSPATFGICRKLK